MSGFERYQDEDKRARGFYISIKSRAEIKAYLEYHLRHVFDPERHDLEIVLKEFEYEKYARDAHKFQECSIVELFTNDKIGNTRKVDIQNLCKYNDIPLGDIFRLAGLGAFDYARKFAGVGGEYYTKNSEIDVVKVDNQILENNIFVYFESDFA